MRILATATFFVAVAIVFVLLTKPPKTSSKTNSTNMPPSQIHDIPAADTGAFDASQETRAKPAATDFLDLKLIEPNIILDIRYASTNNFVGKKIYSVSRCLLRRPVAQALQRVQNRLKRINRQLVVWDCYRPFAIQEQFWALYPDPRYVAKPRRRNGVPNKGSKHNRGAAVDLSLADQYGLPLPMPTDHDDFSTRAHVGATQGLSPEAIHNAKVLHAAMLAEGFEGIPTEWWHFDHHLWREFSLEERDLTRESVIESKEG